MVTTTDRGQTAKRHKAEPISKEQQELIRKYMNDPNMQRTRLARRAGVSLSVVYRYIRKFGGTVGQKDTRDKDVEAYVVAHFANETNRAIAEVCGTSGSTVGRIGKAHGLKKSDEHLAKIRKALVMSVTERFHNDEARQKVSATRRKLFRMERWRVNNGTPQKTRLRMKSMPTKAYQAKWSLMRRHGYIETTDPYTLFYDENTRRMNEAYYEEKYHLRFTEYTGEEED